MRWPHAIYHLDAAALLELCYRSVAFTFADRRFQLGVQHLGLAAEQDAMAGLPAAPVRELSRAGLWRILTNEDDAAVGKLILSVEPRVHRGDDPGELDAAAAGAVPRGKRQGWDGAIVIDSAGDMLALGGATVNPNPRWRAFARRGARQSHASAGLRTGWLHPRRILWMRSLSVSLATVAPMRSPRLACRAIGLAAVPRASQICVGRWQPQLKAGLAAAPAAQHGLIISRCSDWLSEPYSCIHVALHSPPSCLNSTIHTPYIQHRCTGLGTQQQHTLIQNAIMHRHMYMHCGG